MSMKGLGMTGVISMKAYAKPSVTDYGSLVDLTNAVDFAGPEDGATKLELLIPHHTS
jgi:hypothetical protein